MGATEAVGGFNGRLTQMDTDFEKTKLKDERDSRDLKEGRLRRMFNCSRASMNLVKR